MSCEEAHKKALSQCKSHENMVSGDLLENITAKTKVRVAQRETDKLFSIGKACAQLQKQCVDVCSKSLEKRAESSGDVTEVIDFQSDCSEGKVASHRSELAKKYLQMKETLNKARIPSSSK